MYNEVGDKMNTYLIYSNSYHELNEEVNKITKDNSNIIKYDLTSDDLINILEEASYASFLGDKYIVISNSNILFENEDNYSKLEKYFLNPGDAFLIFTSNNPYDERKKLFKLFKEKARIIIKKPLTEKEIVNLVNKIIKENKKNISLSSVNRIVELCQSNYDLILQELNKLFIYFDKEVNIPDDKINEIVSNNIVINNFKFSDAVISKNMAKSFTYFDELKNNKEDVSLLVGLLASQYRLIYTAKIHNKNGLNKDEITNELKIHPYRVELALNNSYNYTESELEDKIKSLAKLDLDIKSGNIDSYAGLEMFLLDI